MPGGWLGQVMKGGGYGVLMDIVLGILGGIVGGWVFGQLGIGAGAGMIGSIVRCVRWGGHSRGSDARGEASVARARHDR